MLGGLGLIGFGRGARAGRRVAVRPHSAPPGRVRRASPRQRSLRAGRRAGVLLLTATGAFAQTPPSGSPYVGNPPGAETGAGAGSAPYVGTAPPEDGPALNGGMYVDALPYVTPAPTPPAGALTVAGRTLSRTPAAEEPAALDAATESPTNPVAGMPVTVGDMVAVVLLAVAALLVVLVPRRRCP